MKPFGSKAGISKTVLVVSEKEMTDGVTSRLSLLKKGSNVTRWTTTSGSGGSPISSHASRLYEVSKVGRGTPKVSQTGQTSGRGAELGLNAKLTAATSISPSSPSSIRPPGRAVSPP